MAISDAVTARGMSQRVLRAIPAIQQNFQKQNALLYLVQKNGQIKWGGSHTEFDWYIRRTTGNAPTWGGGELAARTFEELNPVNKAYLPYCWLEQTYGVSERSLEANKNASGTNKVYDILKENLNIATINLYSALVSAMWSGGSSGNGGDTPIGLDKAAGSPYESTANVIVTALASYANRTLTTAGVSTYDSSKITTGWDDVHWAPVAADLNELPGVTGADGATWAVDAIYALNSIANEMETTADLSGTGKAVKPTHAFMNGTLYTPLTALLTKSQFTYNIPVGSKELTLADFPNVVVNNITVVKDTEVPKGSEATPLNRVFVLDLSKFHICTTHTKSEGLITTEFDTSNPMISGAIGVLKCNLAYMVESPTAVGCIVGCN